MEPHPWSVIGVGLRLWFDHLGVSLNTGGFFDSATRNSRPMSEYLESLKSDSREHRDLGEKTSWRHGDLLGIQSTQGLELDPGMA